VAALRTSNLIQPEGVREQGAEENIWTEEGIVIGCWGELQNERLHNLYFLQYIIRMINARRMR
jgi:hypothetical protein